MAEGFGVRAPVNRTAERYVKGMKKGFHRWKKLYGGRATDVMYATANKMATQEQLKMAPTHNEIFNEAGDYWHPDPEQDKRISGAGNKARAREDAAEKAKPKEDPKKLRPGESYSQYAKRHGGSTVTKPAAKPSLRSRLANKLGRAIDKIGGINNSYDPEGQMVEAKAIGGAPSGLTSVASARRSGSSGQVNRRGRTVTGGASMGGMNIRAAGGLGKEKPAGDDAERAQKYREQVKKDRKAAARERAASGEDRVSRLIRSVRGEGKTYSDFISMCEGISNGNE